MIFASRVSERRQRITDWVEVIAEGPRIALYGPQCLLRVPVEARSPRARTLLLALSLLLSAALASG
jgi:hypothetical protein